MEESVCVAGGGEAKGIRFKCKKTPSGVSGGISPIYSFICALFTFIQNSLCLDFLALISLVQGASKLSHPSSRLNLELKVNSAHNVSSLVSA